jgi:hypothetical protein
VKADRAIKIIAAVCFALIAVALLVARKSPATGYEVSIYTSTPPLVWGCLFFTIACGVGVIVHEVYRKNEHNNLWIIGLIIILLSNVVILSLHIIRGYALWYAAGDPGSHLGLIQDVIATGRLSESNFYPITHICVAQLSLITGANPVVFYKWVPVLFGLLSMVFMYFLAKSLLPQRKQVILATVAGSALIHGWYLNLTPQHLANLLFPFMLFLLVKSFIPGTWQWKALFIIIVFLVAPFHPVPCFVLFVILVTLWLPEELLTRPSPHSAKQAPVGFQPNIVVSTFLLVWGVAWISSFWVWGPTIRNLYTLASEGGPTYATLLIENIAEAQAYGYSITEYFFKVYGGIALYIILALIAFPILRKASAAELDLRRVLALYGPLAAIAIAMGAFYFLNLGFGPSRLLVYVSMISAIPAGFILSQFVDWAGSYATRLRKAASLLVAVVLLAVFVSGTLTVYASPYDFSTNYQTTQTEIQGMSWFLHNRNTKVSISGRCIAPGRFADFLLTLDEREQQGNILWYIPKGLEPPSHFGYNNQSMLGQFYEEDVYLVLNEKDRMFYAIYPEVTEYQLLPRDFVKLAEDPSVDHLYSNGGLDVWYVHAMA